MLKKLLALSLVAAMLGTTVFAASPMGLALTAYAETTPVVEEKTVTATLVNDGDMDFVQITTAADGTQTANDNIETGNQAIDAEDGKWYLAKVKIGGEYSLPLTSMKFQIYYNYLNKTVDFYCVPLKKTDFDMAKTAANTTDKTLTTTLTAPYQSGYPSCGTKTGSSWYETAWSCELDHTLFTKEHYVEEYIYVAFQMKEADGATFKYGFWSNDRGKFTMTVTGQVKRDNASVDLASYSAIYVKNDTSNKTQTVSVNAEPIGKKVQGNDTSWLMLKFTTGKTYTDIVSAKLAVTSGDGLTYGQLEAYKATKEQWDAASASGGTLKSADRQTLLASPPDCGTLIGGKGSISAGNAMELDLTDKCEEQLKSGEVYVYVYVKGDSWMNTVLGVVSLTVTGVEGAYTAPAVTDFDDSVLVWNNGSYGFYTTAASGKALLIAATYTGTTLTDAEVITIDASEEKTNGGYTGTTSLTPGDSLKVFLWNEGTLVPIKSEVIEF